ncbi:MAG: ribose-5-phosphate isomerase RpiA [Chloroflexota bacterium]
MALEELKKQAAEKAVELIESGMVVGLGTGSTAVYAVRAIGRLLQDGALTNIIAIPTSEATAALARECQIPLTTLQEQPVIDLTIDGADEITPNLDLTKGLGGALLREKIVAAASKQNIIIADHTKRVDRLGTRSPIPVEVIPFAEQTVRLHLEGLGAKVVKRMVQGEEERPFITDENNLIFDFHIPPIDNPATLAQAILAQPGIVEHGLFLGLATQAIFATPTGISTIP